MYDIMWLATLFLIWNCSFIFTKFKFILKGMKPWKINEKGKSILTKDSDIHPLCSFHYCSLCNMLLCYLITEVSIWSIHIFLSLVFISSLDYISSTGKMISEWWLAKEVEESGHGLIRGTIPAFAWRIEGKHEKLSN
jgi:hypothetical protein